MLISILACALHMQFYTFATPGANAQSLIFMYIAGGLASFAITFGTHAVCSALIADWFVEKRAKITGYVLSGAGIGAAAWVFLAGQLFKITDYKNCYRIMSVLVLVLGLFAVFFLSKHRKIWTEAWDGNRCGSAGNTADVPGVSYKDALKSSTFKFLVLGLLFTSFGGTVFLSYAPSWWQMNGMSATEQPIGMQYICFLQGDCFL